MKAIKLVVAAVLIGIAGAAMPAQAGGGKHHRPRFFKWHSPAFLVYSGPVISDDCGLFRLKWRKTGSDFWKRQYFRCLGSY